MKTALSPKSPVAPAQLLARPSTSAPSGSTVLTFTEFRSNAYFNGLDGLRALAILLVLLHHTIRFDSAWLATLQENGRYGVSLFFVISGFLICTLFLREEQKTGKIALGKFYGRRALRLMPLYYAVLALHVVLVLGLKQYTPENQQMFIEKMPSYLFYYSNWLANATQGPFFCAWSLAVEEQFYLVFGLLMFAVPRRFLVAAIATALAFKFVVYQTLGNVDTISTAYRVGFSYQEAILWGVLLAFAMNRAGFYSVLSRLFRSTWTVVAVAFATVGWMIGHEMVSQSTWDAELLFVLMTLLVGGIVIRRNPSVLGTGILAHIGKISYGIYLLHMIVVSIVKKLPIGSHPLLAFLATTVITVVLASVVYRYFEQPIIAWYKRRLSPISAPPLQQPTAVPTAQPAVIG